MVTKTKEEILVEMDEAAEKAAEDFKAVIATNPDGVESVAKWWKDHYGTAGHKRLARIVISVV